MSRSILAAVALAAWSMGVQGQSGCQYIGGNNYCGSTDAVTYNNVGFSGTYNSITSMNTDGCTCQSAPQAFSGGLAPLNDEISLHIRGPCQLASLAVYHRTSSSKVKREAEPEAEAEAEPEAHGGLPFPALGRHKRGHSHHRHERRHGGGVVTVTETTYFTSTRRHVYPATSSPCTTSATATVATAPAPAVTNTAGSTGDWTRDSYYNAASGSATNLVFTNHLGGTNGSGVWDSCFGNSLSYAAADGVHGAASSTVLGNVLIPSDNEIAIFTAEPCGSDCGFYRTGTPAYRGFDSSQDMVILVEFTMPHDGNTGFNGDMSAIWFLNAQIPRTLQYGNAACSCWTTGCGELDVFEILSTGSDYLTTTLHSWQGTNTQYGGGGSSMYFERPTSSPMTAAIVFTASSKSINIVTLSNGASFDESLMDSDISEWCSTSGTQINIAG